MSRRNARDLSGRFDPDHFASERLAQHLQNKRSEGCKHSQPVVGCREQDDRQGQSTKIMLKLEILIDRQKRLEDRAPRAPPKDARNAGGHSDSKEFSPARGFPGRPGRRPAERGRARSKRSPMFLCPYSQHITLSARPATSPGDAALLEFRRRFRMRLHPAAHEQKS